MGKALFLAADGANVIINGCAGTEALDAVVSEIRAAGGNTVAARADRSKPDEVGKMGPTTWRSPAGSTSSSAMPGCGGRRRSSICGWRSGARSCRWRSTAHSSWRRRRFLDSRLAAVLS